MTIPDLATGARDFYGENFGSHLEPLTVNLNIAVWDDCGHSLALEQLVRLADRLLTLLP